ncbi:hypothetical protein [Streptomyces sp. NPDC005336]|uniref:hypothetical protein n=1 Tax=Streptomyces sp. NPDC005336 TaxID=3157035 RepID=UPI0033B12782
MPAAPHTRPAHPADSSMEIRLPWWAVALPALAFAALLLLLAGPTEAHAASGSGALPHFLGLVHQALGHAAP